MLHAIDSLVALFPDDNTFQLTRVNVLRDLGRREERVEAPRRQTLRKGADRFLPTITPRRWSSTRRDWVKPSD